jgi:WD40 repeat protein
LDPTKDREGNPLPKGATARLGSLTFRGPNVNCVVFSADGKRLLSFVGKERLSWNAATGKPMKAQPLAPVDRLGRAAVELVNDRLFALERQEKKPGKAANPPVTLKVIDIATGRELSQIPCDRRTNLGWNVSISDDGRYLALLSTPDKTVVVYEASTGKKLHAQKVEDVYRSRLRISPDNKTLFVLQPKKAIQRYELVSGKAMPELEGTVSLAGAGTLVASPDGKRVVTCAATTFKDARGEDVGVTLEETLLIHDPIANKLIGKLAIGADPLFDFAGPNALIVLGAKYRPPVTPVFTLSRWNLDTHRREWQVKLPFIPEACQCLAISPDGSRCAVSNRGYIANVYDTATGRLIAEPTGHSTPISWIGFTRDGERITTAGQDGIRTWAVNGERKSVVNLPEVDLGDLRHEHFGEHLAWITYSENGKKTELVGWDNEKGGIGWRMPLEAPPARVLTHDGKQCLGFSWNNARLAWDVTVYDGPARRTRATWTLDSALSNESQSWPPLALSANGRMLFVGGKQGILGLDIATGKERLRIAAPSWRPDVSSKAQRLAASPDGTRIAAVVLYAATSRSGLQVYDIATRKLVAEHPLGQTDVSSLRFSPNGKSVAAWGDTVLLFDAESSQTEPRKLESGNGPPVCVAFRPNGASLAVGYQDGTALVWDLVRK